MVFPSEDSSPKAWFNRVVSVALEVSADGADAWCAAVAGAMAEDGLTRAAIVAIDDGAARLASGASDPAPGADLAGWLAGLSGQPAVWGEDELFASGEYGSELTHGEVRVAFGGSVGLRRQHVPLVASLLAEVYRHRIADPTARRQAILAQLRPSQRPILPLLSRGMSQRDISRELGKSPHTIHDHTKMIYRTLDVHSRVELAALWHGFPIEADAED